MNKGAPAIHFGKQPPFWNIGANPIFRLYCRSRLRMRGLGVTLLVTLIIAAFLTFFVPAITNRMAGNPEGAARTPLIPLLYLQGLILFMLGTGQVAGGITAEHDEGVLDYQRLAPLSPLHKALGYLFGLPVREYVACLATLPFTVWATVKGDVDWAIMGKLYLAFFVSAVLYHLTGLITGTIVKNKRWAFLISMGAIFFLYTVMPQIARAGLSYFQYLTISPVFKECAPYLMPKDIGAGLMAWQNLMAVPSFFNLHIPVIVLTAGTQLILIITGMVMLCRRWRRWESHMLGKAWALGLFVWLQVLLLGNALPLIESGRIFPTRAARRYRFDQSHEWHPEAMEAVMMAGIYGIVTLALLWIMTLMITPNPETQLRGWRRAHKLNRKSLSVGADPSTGFVWVLCMAAAGTAGWWIFTRAVIQSHWFPGQHVPAVTLAAYALTFLSGSLSIFALLEWRGVRTVAFYAILIGLVPILVAAIIGAASDRLGGVASWFASLSPATAPVFASTATLPMSDLPPSLLRAVPRAFWFWQSVILLAAVYFLLQLRKARKEIKRSASF